MTPDERDEYEDRAAIMQHHGGMPREQAEREAKKRIEEKRKR